MFFDELFPVVQELTGQPVAFLGGFVAGVLRLGLGDEPVKSWLDQHIGSDNFSVSDAPASKQNGRSKGPQSISID